MGKAERLRKKKAEENKPKGKILQEIHIKVFDDGQLTVDGPINAPLVVMDMLAGALKTIVDHNFSTAKHNADIEEGRKKKEKKRIISA